MYLDAIHFLSKAIKASFLVLMFISPFSHCLTLEEQRNGYLDAIDAFVQKDYSKFNQLKKQLKDYPLYPYLEYRAISLELDDLPYKKVAAFLRKYPDLAFRDMVHARYFDNLVKKRNWKDLIKFQKTEPFAQVNKCNYYYAHSQAGNKKLALQGANKLYLSGSSVSSACDKLFKVLDKNAHLSAELLKERMLLVFEANNRRLLQYLAKQLAPKNKKVADEVMRFYRYPEKVLSIKKSREMTSYQRHLYKLAFKRLARISPEKAITNFDLMASTLRFSRVQKQEMADYIASRIMSADEPSLIAWRDTWLMKSDNQSLLERRFRLALTANDRQDTKRWINHLSEEKQAEPKWQYWKARILIEEGEVRKAKSILKDILGQRDFYSVAAAMYLNEDISIPTKSTKPAFGQLQRFSDALARVSELEVLQRVSESKSEWSYILKRADRKKKAILAAYALDKAWYAHAVQATIAGKLWEHLEYRFPVAHRYEFERFSRENNLPITTLLALSRQESAFHPEAISPVGARGLMQLMPATAKETSSRLGMRYYGVKSLSDPNTNIRLGSGYLRMLLDQFGQNRILAFAAYNAGPNRVDSWLERTQGNLDVISFIEGIPFRETRGYVQNVLMYEIYYRKLLGMPMQFLYEQELAYNY